MARRVFFSFHYERDVWRANQVRNSWVTKPDRQSAGFWDAADWEAVKRGGNTAIERWIRDQMKGTSVTVVLIGAETASRQYVQYEMKQSWIINNGLIGIYINNLKDSNGHTDIRGADPFEAISFNGFNTYDWVSDNGYTNLGRWVEEAAGRVAARNK